MIKNLFGWGVLLWFFGYVLGIILFMLVPVSVVGWVIMPVGIVAIVWVLIKKIKITAILDYLKLAIVWTLMAIVLDYFFLVKVFKPSDGYYKLDVYLYYILTFILPLVVGWLKARKRRVVG